jgi:hypothetical protein
VLNTPLPSIPDISEVKGGIQALDVSFDSADTTPASVEGAVTITLADEGSTASDSSKVTIDGKKITVTAAGTYAMSGTLKGGQIVVYVSKDDDVSLILNDVNIDATGTEFVPVSFYDTERKGEAGIGKRIVTLLGENVLQDDPKAKKTGVYDPKPKGVIYSEQTLTVNGTGSATLTAKSHSGIFSLAKLKIANVGKITVTEAPNSALRGDYGVIIKGGVFDLKSVKETITKGHFFLPHKKARFWLINAYRAFVYSGLSPSSFNRFFNMSVFFNSSTGPFACA